MTGSNTKAKPKFSSKNLNALYKAPLTKAVDNAGLFPKRMLVLGNRTGATAAKTHLVAAPTPINTPSLRKENQGQDVHINLVPSGRTGWGGSSNNDTIVDEKESEQSATAEPVERIDRLHDPKPRVWGAPSSTIKSNPGSMHSIGTTSSGRWGDDAVEQDIVQSTRFRQLQQEREFPTLQDAVAEGIHYHENHQQSHHGHSAIESGGHHSYTSQDERYASRMPLPDGNPYDRFQYDHNSSHGYRYNHNDYGSHGGHSHSHYNPSDARYNRYMGYTSANSHNQLDNHGYYAPDRHPYHRRHVYEDERPYKNDRRLSEHEMDRREIHYQPSLAYRHESSFQSPTQVLGHNGIARAEDPKQMHQYVEESNQSEPPLMPSTIVDKSCSRGLAEAITLKNTLGTHQEEIPATTSSAQLPASKTTNKMNEQDAENTAAVSSVPRESVSVSNTQVRILKRSGPKMLFDPKTGGMINADDIKTSGSRRSRSSSPAIVPVEEKTVTVENVLVKKQCPLELKQTDKEEKGDNISDSLPKSDLVSPAKKSPIAFPAVVEHNEKQKLVSKAVKPRVGRSEPAEDTDDEPPILEHDTGKRKSLQNKRVVAPSKGKKYTVVYRPVVKKASSSAPTEINTINISKITVKQEELDRNSTVKEDKHDRSFEQNGEATSKSIEIRKSTRPIRLSATKHRDMAKARPSPILRSKAMELRHENTSDRGHMKPDNQLSANQHQDRIDSSTSDHISTMKSKGVHHSKARMIMDVDILKHIPEGGGVVVLTDAQEGIEFLPDDAANRFQTVKSRRVILLEKKRLREAATRHKRPQKRQIAAKNQLTTTKFVFAAPQESKVRALLVGVRVQKAMKTASIVPTEECRIDTSNLPQSDPVSEVKTCVKNSTGRFSSPVTSEQIDGEKAHQKHKQESHRGNMSDLPALTECNVQRNSTQKPSQSHSTVQQHVDWRIASLKPVKHTKTTRPTKSTESKTARKMTPRSNGNGNTHKHATKPFSTHDLVMDKSSEEINSEHVADGDIKSLKKSMAKLDRTKSADEREDKRQIYSQKAKNVGGNITTNTKKKQFVAKSSKSSSDKSQMPLTERSTSGMVTNTDECKWSAHTGKTVPKKKLSMVYKPKLSAPSVPTPPSNMDNPASIKPQSEGKEQATPALSDSVISHRLSTAPHKKHRTKSSSNKKEYPNSMTTNKALRQIYVVKTAVTSTTTPTSTAA